MTSQISAWPEKGALASGLGSKLTIHDYAGPIQSKMNKFQAICHSRRERMYPDRLNYAIRLFHGNRHARKPKKINAQALNAITIIAKIMMSEVLARKFTEVNCQVSVFRDQNYTDEFSKCNAPKDGTLVGTA
jgi:hypothetical protein